MQRWEYMELEAELSGQFGEWYTRGITYQVDGKHQEFENNQIGLALAKIGQEGWELVACFHLPNNGTLSMLKHVHYVFKRELDRVE